MLRILLSVAISLSVLAGCQSGSSKKAVSTDIPFRADGILDFIGSDGKLVTRIAIEIAESDSAQTRGLMDRRSLPKRGGMIFIDSEPSERSFWMRNTPLPLDIIFVRSDSSIANIVEQTTPYSDLHIDSDGLAQFVVEVRAGFASSHSILPGQHVRWSRSN